MGTHTAARQEGQDTGLRAGISRQRAYITFGVISLALIMSQIISTIVTVGLPTITDSFRQARG